jgi:SPP1 gp7 family putative phage head morphogenesis protein
MTDEQKAAYIMGQVACMNAELAVMRITGQQDPAAATLGVYVERIRDGRVRDVDLVDLVDCAAAVLESLASLRSVGFAARFFLDGLEPVEFYSDICRQQCGRGHRIELSRRRRRRRGPTVRRFWHAARGLGSRRSLPHVAAGSVLVASTEAKITVTSPRWAADATADVVASVRCDSDVSSIVALSWGGKLSVSGRGRAHIGMPSVVSSADTRWVFREDASEPEPKKPRRPSFSRATVTRVVPVHPVVEKGEIVGYQWGEHGKVYRSKKKAQAQAAAIYASGWREDADVRRARREIAMALRAHTAAERQYVASCDSIVRGVHRGILAMIHREILPEYETRHDAAGDKTKRLLGDRPKQKIVQHLRPRVITAYDTMASAVKKKNDRAMDLIGIPIHDAAAGVLPIVAVARENNVRLISHATEEWLDDVRDTLDEDEAEGLRVEEIAKHLEQRSDVGAARARLVARDQTLKLASSITQARQVHAGISQYRWSTSKDERVRDMHADLEGQIIDWDDPPVTDKYGNTNHAGQDYQCRCVAIPLLPGLDYTGDDEESSGAAADEAELETV